MPSMTGRRVGLSLPRKWIADLMSISRGIPAVTIERKMRLADVHAARGNANDPPSWPSLFIKAYSLAAKRFPELRRTYQSYPWPHLYEADKSLASVAIARDYEGESAVFFGLIHAPDEQSLRQITVHLNDYKNKPIKEIRSFARLIRYTGYPLLIRRLMWRLGMNLSGKHRVKTFGTFGLTALGSSGACLINPIAPTTTTITYGPFSESGEIDVRLIFDHRVLDGLTAAKVLNELETILKSEMVQEITNM